MISYCIACYRVPYAKLLIEELIKKTSCQYEILLWLNMKNDHFSAFIVEKIMQGIPIRVIGVSEENIGMFAYEKLFQAARYELITQIDDDVIRISYGIAERAAVIFNRYPRIQQLVADVWQDEWTTGSRPPMADYRVIKEDEGLYDGLIDGWFSIYRRSMLPVLMKVPYKKYEFIGSWARHLLREEGLFGLLCTQFKVLHLSGPAYALLFDQLDQEIAKYNDVGRQDVVEAYESARHNLPDKTVLQAALDKALADIDQHHLHLPQS